MHRRKNSKAYHEHISIIPSRPFLPGIPGKPRSPRKPGKPSRPESVQRNLHASYSYRNLFLPAYLEHLVDREHLRDPVSNFYFIYYLNH